MGGAAYDESAQDSRGVWLANEESPVKAADCMKVRRVSIALPRKRDFAS